MKYLRIEPRETPSQMNSCLGSSRDAREYLCFKGNQDAILALVNLEPERAAYFATTFNDADFKRAFVNAYANHTDWHHTAYFMAKDIGFKLSRKAETRAAWEDLPLDAILNESERKTLRESISKNIRGHPIPLMLNDVNGLPGSGRKLWIRKKDLAE